MKTGSASAATSSRRAITEPLAGQILNYIRSEVLRPGTHLSAQHLADRFHVSRSPVNRALVLLAESKIVTHESGRGFLVAAGAHSETGQHRNVAGPDPLASVYFTIVNDLLQGELGDRISARSLQMRYGLTRGQVTQLLDRMVREGWAERRPGYGWMLASVITTPEALEKSYRLRLAIEPAGLLEPSFNLPQDVARLAREREQELLRGGIESLPPDVLYERGVQFHEMLAEASGNPFFLESLQRVNRMRRLFAYRTMDNRDRYYRQVSTHLRILDLLAEGRNAEAADTMRGHLLEVLESMRGLAMEIARVGNERKAGK
jgi:DNA-binding GntR family transcriptional regulator